MKIYVFLLNGWQIIKVRASGEKEAWEELPWKRPQVELLEWYLLQGPWLLKGPWRLL
jgi:hypothetical protein